VDVGGTITVITGEVDIGQGSNTIFSQIVAEELGIPSEMVRIVSGDSNIIPHTGGSGASRVTYMGGSAVRQATVKVKEKLLAATAEQLNLAADALEAKDSKISVKGTPEKAISIFDVMDSILSKEGPIVATASRRPATTYATPMDPETGQGTPFEIYVYATQIADIEVDTETGLVKVLRIVAAHDVGKAINPALVEGQIHGGIGFGLGQAIMENMAIRNGRTVNPNFMDYLIPTSVDMPELNAIIVEEHEPSGPFGAKGVGEPPNLPTAPAIINAIYNAVGVRITDLPATPEKILKALKEKKRQP
jgi:CO/xanthine dehydrogenase Mo-binding subunit